MANETICKHCNQVFASRGKYNHHFRVEHQNLSRNRNEDFVQDNNNQNEQEKLGCICGKSYTVWNSLYRHQKSCQAWKDDNPSQQRNPKTTGSMDGKKLC
jgi:hypothetical protein